MDVLAMPWMHYAMLMTATLSALLFWLLLWICWQGIAREENRWLTAMCFIYTAVSLLSLRFLEITEVSDFRANNVLRLGLTHVGLLLALGYMESYLRDWHTYFFKAMAVVITLPWLYMVAGFPLEQNLVLDRIALPWGEVVTAMAFDPHPLLHVRNWGTAFMFLVPWVYAWAQIGKGNAVKRHLVLVAAMSVPMLNAVVIGRLASGHTIPLAQFGAIGFGLVMLLAIFQEIASSRRLSVQVAEREAQMRFMASQVPGALFSLDMRQGRSGDVLFVSERFWEILGISPGNAEPIQALLQGLGEQDRVRQREAFRQDMARLGASEYSMGYRRPDGRRLWLQAFTHFSRHGSSVHCNGVLMDVSDRIKKEEERSALLKEVTLRRDELESLLFTLGHDLRTPLVNVDLYASEAMLLLGEGEAWQRERQEECQGHLGKLRGEVKRMSALIATLLLLGRKSRDVLHLARVPMEPLLKDVVRELRMESQGMEVFIQAPLPACWADGAQLHQVLARVLENSLAYRKPGLPGKVTVEAGVEAGRVRLSISDDGIGFPAQYAETIFQTFHQLNPSEQHQGVGLTLARLSLARMDGSVGAQSEPGVGTIITIELPACE